ncbi:MAG: ATP-binding protein [Acidimicrobiales bacterium]
MLILERDGELARLAAIVDGLGGGGRIALVYGEPGVGKSTLVQRFLEQCGDRAAVLHGACDDLLAPQPLGPIWDMARDETTLGPPLAHGDRRAVMEVLLNLLSRPQPTVVALDDVQWSDDATLDTITFLGRRIGKTNGVLVLSFRDELDRHHQLRKVLAELRPEHVDRLALQPLSDRGVRELVAGSELDPDVVLALTEGNPLFVTELLAVGADEIPASVRDTVLSRIASVTPKARVVLDLVSVAPGGIELAMVEEAAGDRDLHIEDSVVRGLLVVADDHVSYRHDLQRRAVEEALTPSARQKLNQNLLDAIGDSVDSARIVHHAVAADDVDSIVRFALRAAREAMAIESTSEAVSHFRLLEPHLDLVNLAERVAILTDWAKQEYFLDSARSALLYRRAIEMRRQTDDPIALAELLTTASVTARAYGHHDEAGRFAAEAVSLLEPGGASEAFARALSQHAYLAFIYQGHVDTAMSLVELAEGVADEIGSDLAMMYGIRVKAQLLACQGDPEGHALAERSVELACAAGDHFAEIVALTHAAGLAADERDVDRAIDFATRARDTSRRHEVRSREVDIDVMLAEYEMWRGDWTSAEATARDWSGSKPSIESIAHRILATIETRRGRRDARSAIDEMLELVLPGEGLWLIDPAATAIAEYLWLSGDRDPELLGFVDDAHAAGVSAGRPWPSGSLTFWMWKLSLIKSLAPGTAGFLTWIVEGGHAETARFCRDRQLPYEEGLALMHGTKTNRLDAIRIFDGLGAVAASNRVRELLGEKPKRVHRGAGRSTVDNKAGLTARQAEVLGLLGSGASNAEIADELFLSTRTVEHHVSAVLQKLEVRSREDAVKTGVERGLLQVP